MQAPSTPIIVTVVEENEIAGLGDVMLQAIGLTGAIAIGALVFGLVLASVIIGYRKLRARLDPEQDAQTQPLGLTPTEPVLKPETRI
jgi:hypothetical protein